MSSRSLNKVQLIGNLTRDPELRYTPSGAAVCTIGLATNRSWTTESGERKEETEFHRIVAWNKLAELCSQLLSKGRKIFVEGRLRTNSWQQADGAQRSVTEIVIEDMILLDSRRIGPSAAPADDSSVPPATAADTGSAPAAPVDDVPAAKPKKPKTDKEDKADDGTPPSAGGETLEDVNPDDIPF